MLTALLTKKLPTPTVSPKHPAGRPPTCTAPPYGLAAEPAAFSQSAGISTGAMPDGQLVPPALPSANALGGLNTTAGAGGAAQAHPPHRSLRGAARRKGNGHTATHSAHTRADAQALHAYTLRRARTVTDTHTAARERAHAQEHARAQTCVRGAGSARATTQTWMHTHINPYMQARNHA
jgi:hypothetical protein